MRDGSEIAFLGSGCESATYTHGDRSGVDPVGNILQANTAGWHELCLRKRRSHCLHEGWPQGFARKDLHDVSARLHRLDHFADRRSAGHIGHLIAIAQTGGLEVERRTDYKLRSR